MYGYRTKYQAKAPNIGKQEPWKNSLFYSIFQKIYTRATLQLFCNYKCYRITHCFILYFRPSTPEPPCSYFVTFMSQKNSLFYSIFQRVYTRTTLQLFCNFKCHRQTHCFILYFTESTPEPPCSYFVTLNVTEELIVLFYISESLHQNNIAAIS